MPHSALPHIPGYRILRRLGAGASGTVFHAIQAGTDREVALKLFEPVDNPGATQPEEVERERRVASSLRHRNLARIHAMGDYGERRWLACEYLSGGTLAERIAARMPLANVLDTLRDITRGLGHAHARGIVHGDVKPSNVLFRDTGEAVLVDYGVAAFSQEGQVASQGGTPDYMSPEQARGEAMDGRSDFYSLGVTLFEMLTGRIPPRGQPGELPVPYVIPELPDRVHWLQPVLDALLAEDPGDRPADAAALLSMLVSLRVASPEAAVLAPAIREERMPRIHGISASPSIWRKRSVRVFIAVLVLVALGIVLLR